MQDYTPTRPKTDCEIQDMFVKQYPNIPFSELVKQMNHRYTDDASTHYYYKLTGEVFSYDYIQFKWYQASRTYQDHIIKLFF